MEAKDLLNINDKVRNMITDYIKKHEISEYSFAKNAGIHQNQLWMYLHANDPKKGLHTSTLEKIGLFLSKK